MTAPYIPPGDWEGPRDLRAVELAQWEVAVASLADAVDRKYMNTKEVGEVFRALAADMQARRQQLGDAP